MSIVVKMPSASEQRERRLHLREVSQEETAMKLAGAVLREKRIELGLDEKSIASKLKMRMDQLRAIEHSDYAKLPGRTYAVGFIRAYAKSLGLDAEALVEQFKSETQSHELGKPAELVFPEVAPAPKWPSGGIVVVAIVVAIVIYGIAQLTMPGAETAKTASVDDSSVTVVDATPAAGAPKATEAAGGVTVSPEMPATKPILPVIGNDAAMMDRLPHGQTNNTFLATQRCTQDADQRVKRYLSKLAAGSERVLILPKEWKRLLQMPYVSMNGRRAMIPRNFRAD